MNNEIKEIKINKANKSVTFINNGIAFSQFGIADEILDLITNLQQEIKEANDSITWWTNRFKAVERDNRELKQENKRLQENNQNMQEEMARTWEKCEDYKSRCEKANNQLKIIMQIIKEQPTRNIEDDEWLENRLIGVVNILQNGSDDNE